MDTSLLLELNKQSSPSPSAAQPPLPPHYTPWPAPWDAWPISPSLHSTPSSEDGGLPASSSSSDSSSAAACSPCQGPSPASPCIPDQGRAHPMAATEPPAAASAYPAADCELMDPVMAFISEMLMDEQMEDRKCMQQECTAHQAIVNGFYQVLGDDSSPPSSYRTEQSSRHGLGPFKDQPGTDDYSWIDKILAENPFQEKNVGGRAWPLDHRSSVFNDLEQDPKLWPWPLEPTSSSRSDQDLKVWSLASSSSGSNDSQDSSDGLLRHSYGVFPSSAMVPPDNHTSISPSLPSFPTMQGILHNDAMPSQADLVSGNGLIFEGHSQSPCVLKSRFRDFRKVRSDMTGGNDLLSFRMEDGFERAVSDKFLEDRKQPQPCDAPSKVVEDQELSFVNNEDLNAENNAKIHGDWSPANDDCIAKMRQARGLNRKRKGRPEPVDLGALLVNCAEALASNNLRKAKEIVQELQQHASQHGSAAQRLAHYFTKALVARLSGTGARLYTVMSDNRPSAADMVKAFRLMMDVCPYAKLAHFFANQSILKAAEGASRVHIVDYGIFDGVQWPCLISVLAERKGGPPFLRITGIDFPQPGVNPAERIEATGRRLAEYARAYNVPFEYHAIARKWEDIQASDLKLKKGEILVVNCIHRLRHLMDETVVTPSPRRKVLSRIHSLSPNMVLIAVMNAGFYAPFFLTRFREALYYFSSKFDMIDTMVADSENLQRLMIEREYFGRDILNVVACEGQERIERPETYRQWHAHFERAGFEPISLSRSVLSKARDVVKAFYHKDYSVDYDSKWMLLGWKGRIFEGLSAWMSRAPVPGDHMASSRRKQHQ